MGRKLSKSPVEQDVQELLDGRVRLYRRRDSNKVWHYRIWVKESKRYIRKSTSTPNLIEARTIAEDAFYDTRAKQRGNLPVFTKTFKEIYEIALQDETRKLARGEITQKRHDLITSKAALYYLPFFKNKLITSITTSTIREYWNFRLDYWNIEDEAELERLKKKHKAHRVTKNPKGSTLHLENRVLHMVFQKAEELHYLNPQQRPQLDPPAKNEKERRPALTMPQWQKMRDFMCNVYRYESGVGVNDKKRRIRHLLYYYCVCMVSTGMRVADMRNVKWLNLSKFTDNHGNVSTLLQVFGKGKQRNVIAVPLLHDIMQEWRENELNEYTTDDDYIFPHYNGTACQDLGEIFETMKKYAERTEDYSGITTDYMGENITVYSLRHTYATFQRMYCGTSYEDLSANMGNSPKVLKAHYDKTQSTDMAERLNKMPQGTVFQSPIQKAIQPAELKNNIIETALFGNIKDEKDNPLFQLLDDQITKEEYKELKEALN